MVHLSLVHLEDMVDEINDTGAVSKLIVIPVKQWSIHSVNIKVCSAV